jgi:hypothetical protein
MTKEDRAKIARENGAKSQGPKTQAGKAASSRNAIRTGEHATKLELFVPPHSAVLCNEERQHYARLVERLLNIYLPMNDAALSIVKSIAIARWEIERLRACITMHWNLALVENAQIPATLAPELLEMHAMVRASASLYANNGPVRQLNGQIDQLELRIARLERRLKFLHLNFPNSGEKSEPIENTQEQTGETPNVAENEPPVYVTENTPDVIAAYKRLFPDREIVVLPADDVAKGIDIDDDMPTAPRRAA